MILGRQGHKMGFQMGLPPGTCSRHKYFVVQVSMLVLQVSEICNSYTVKPVLSSHSKKDKTKILMTNGSLMKAESIAECSSFEVGQYHSNCARSFLA